MLENWYFDDDAANAPRGNRQKSATELIVLSIDQAAQTATFFDHKREQENTATLRGCTCHDFSFAGKSPRKSFGPCMHIYRLATELGLFVNKYEDPAQRITPERAAEIARRHALSGMKQAEDDRLRALPKSPDEWGGWCRDVHLSGVQRNRQLRAYSILDDEPGAVKTRDHSVEVHGNGVMPARCECPDFEARRLPCKHMYLLALSDGIDLPVSASEYQLVRAAGKQQLFEYYTA